MEGNGSVTAPSSSVRMTGEEKHHMDCLNRLAVSFQKTRPAWRLVWIVASLGLVALGAGAPNDFGDG